MTRLICKTTYDDKETITVSIATNRWDLNVSEFIEELVIPLMKGIEYSEKSINDYLKGKENEN